MKNFLKLKKTTRKNLVTYAMVILAFLAVWLLSAGGSISSAFRGQLVPICVYIVMAISLNLTVGILGELSLGHAGFMSLGAFTGVIVSISLQGSVSSDPLRLTIAMILGAVIAGIAGLVVGVPALRLRGDYLAIVTLAFGEIIKNIINTLYVGIGPNGFRISMVNAESLNLGENGTVIMNGPMGAVGIPKLATFTSGFILIMITLFIVLNLQNSRSGRAIMAVRDNRIAAESVGISVTRYKLMAFIISAALAGAAGALYALNFSTVVARKFDFNTSILILVFVVLGGMGNIRGSIIAATVLTVLPELLRAFNNYRMLLYSVILILVMLMSNNEQLKNMMKKFTGFFKIKRPPDLRGGTARE
ncbi:MAG: branched-chain amino acid ABC transporter permease [Saccharofermentanales bacterium]